MNKKVYLTFIILLSLVSCISNQSNKPDNTHEQSIQSSVEPTIQPSATIDYPKIQCFKEKKELDGRNFGSLIMVNESETELLIKELSTGENKIIPLDANNIVENVITTSDSNTIAYQTYSHTTKNRKFHVIESYEKPETIYDLSSDIQGVISFIDRTKLLVSIRNAPVNDYPVNADLAILDISKNTLIKIPLDLPYFSNMIPFPWGTYGSIGVVPSKDLNYFVYQKFWDENDKTTVAIWDYKNSRTVKALYQISTPQWSSDSTFFIASGPVAYESESNELYKVMISGEIRQLTNFSNIYLKSYIGVYKLSPDNNIIGFPFSESTDNTTTLLLLNISTGDLIDTCIEIYPFYHDPLWAPGSDALIVGDYRDHAGSVYLVDIINKTYTIIDHDRFAVGWIVK
jgi:hypothetical protein